MKCLSNNSFFGYFLALSMVIVLGLSPIQNISASVSSCMEMESTMHHQMNTSSHNSLVSNMSDTTQMDNLPDCCNENECSSTHCTGVTAAITSDTFSNVSYTDNTVYQMSNILLTPFYPSSLYRPPKI